MTQPFNLLGPARFTLAVRDDFGQSASANVAVNFVAPAASAPPFVTITSPTGSLEGSFKAHFAGVVTDPAGGPVTYRWSIFDPRTSIEAVIGTVPAFDLAIDQKYEGRAIEIRLTGTNKLGVTTLKSQSMFVQALPR